MSTDISRRRQDDVVDILRVMREHRCEFAKLQSQGPSMGVMDVVRWLLGDSAESQDPERANKILTRVLRLPGRQRSLLMEYLNDAPAYRGKSLNLLVAVKNTGSVPIEVLTDTTIVPHIAADTGEELDTNDTLLDYVTLEPGATITLNTERAGQIIRERSRAAWEPSARSYPHDHDDVEEVGYSYALDGQQIGVGELSTKRKRAAA